MLDKNKITKKSSREKLGRLDINSSLKEKIRPYCRLTYGDVWVDPVSGHKVGVLDAVERSHIAKLMDDRKAKLVVNDPPYNVVVGNSNTSNLFKTKLGEYLDFSRKWMENCIEWMDTDSHLYIWIGADQNDGFQPLPDFMVMMREFEVLKSRSFITMRNQRGYGTQKNWMCARQELLYYTMGKPDFHVTYTDIPKILRGYYKSIKGKMTENIERSKSDTIRPGNVWVDIQQVFYRMEENVPGAYAQKPLKVIDRIIESSSSENDLVLDYFAHSGSTLISCEKMKRICYTIDVDPVFAELTIRRLENYRKTGKTGWQWNNPFPEIDPEIN